MITELSLTLDRGDIFSLYTVSDPSIANKLNLKKLHIKCGFRDSIQDDRWWEIYRYYECPYVHQKEALLSKVFNLYNSL